MIKARYYKLLTLRHTCTLMTTHIIIINYTGNLLKRFYKLKQKKKNDIPLLQTITENGIFMAFYRTVFIISVAFFDKKKKRERSFK